MMRKSILSVAISALILGASPLQAGGTQSRCGEGNECRLPDPFGKMLPDERVWESVSAPLNTETRMGEAHAAEIALEEDCAVVSSIPYALRVSVDGVPVGRDWPINEAQSQRCMDVSVEKADVQIRFDSLEQTPWLNIHATSAEQAEGGSVSFATYSNYAAWVENAEVRIFSSNKTTHQTPYAVIPVTIGQAATWKNVPVNEDRSVGAEWVYVLRVYDKQGRFDETRPKTLAPTRLENSLGKKDHLAGYGENSRLVENIRVEGGAVTVNGSKIMKGQTVYVMGLPVPVDGKGRFAVRQILPPGPHQVKVAVKDSNGIVSEFSRNLTIANDKWFYVGIADLTMGKNNVSGPAELVTADEGGHYDGSPFVDGRLAFYLKGKVKGKYLLTAAADTQEQPFEDLFSNFSSKDPRYLLRRLDPERYYPVYGDDSTTVEDAPTQGKFYVRIERGASKVLWGNFHTSITGTEFSQYNRGLYGAQVKLVSDDSTSFGERRGTLEGFAADPGSLPARDEFRGTGGSLYYMRRQDVSQGSERVWVEVRDKDTGLVLETRYLVAAQDYDVNYLQGRIMLRDSLSSTSSDNALVKTGNISGHHQLLVVTYEYTPGLEEIDDFVRGGRGQYWVNDKVNIGVSSYRQKSPGAEQKLNEVDVTIRHKAGTYLKIEGARSDGPGSGSATSFDGGYSFTTKKSPGGEADARRIEAAVDFSEISDQKGRASVYLQDRDKGFSGPGQIATTTDIKQQGLAANWQASDKTELSIKANEKDGDDREVQAAEVDVHHKITDHWTLGAGLRLDSREIDRPTSSEVLNEEGSRTDLALRAEYQPTIAEGEAEWSAYGYAQGSLKWTKSRSRNNRLGFGGKRRFTNRFTAGGELSGGDGGLGALLSGDYRYDDRSTFYLNYELDSDRSDTGYRGRRGLLTGGARTRFSDSVSVFGEERLQHGDGPSGLTHAFGIDLAPDEHWSYGLTMEAGELSDPDAGDMDRKAVSLSLGYSADDWRFTSNLEYRDEEGNLTDRKTWLFRNSLGYQVDPDWRFIGRLNIADSEASAGDFFDGDYVELVTGYAYRPVKNDRLNALFKYTYFYNLPSPGQLADSGSLADYSQRSHVLSVDGIYDLKPWVSVGGKYAYRFGELRDSRNSGPWFDSTAQLLVGRADFHWVHKWDMLVEARYLDVDAADDDRFGWLLAAYRHMNKNVKVGVGYNFTDFSDDLTDLSYRSSGWFLNVVGKM